MDGVTRLRMRLRQDGLSDELQKRLDIACVSPHIHPRWLRNDENKPRRRIRRKISNFRWRTEYGKDV